MFPQVEEYVCLKVIAMVQLEEDATLSYIHERYLNCLKSFTRLHFPNEPKRAENLLKKLPAVSAYSPWLKLPTHKFILTPTKWGCNGYSSFWVNPITDCLLLSSRYGTLPRSSWSRKCFTCHSCWIHPTSDDNKGFTKAASGQLRFYTSNSSCTFPLCFIVYKHQSRHPYMEIILFGTVKELLTSNSQSVLFQSQVIGILIGLPSCLGIKCYDLGLSWR